MFEKKLELQHDLNLTIKRCPSLRIIAEEQQRFNQKSAKMKEHLVRQLRHITNQYEKSTGKLL